jgi:hypothetical protein
MILPGAPICIVLGGSWSDLGCSVILECSAFLLPDFLLDPTLFTEDVILSLNFFAEDEWFYKITA